MIKFALATAMATLIAGAASASGVTFTSTAFDSSPAAGQTLVEDFDHQIANGYTFNGGKLETGSTVGIAADPAGDKTTYDAVIANRAAVFTSSKDMASASVYLGSMDSYNYVEFLNNGELVASFSGDQLISGANGDQHNGDMNRRFNFNFGGQAVNEIVFGSKGNSFEFDNIAVGLAGISAAPEPSVWLMLMVGIGGVGMMLRRKTSILSAAAA